MVHRRMKGKKTPFPRGLGPITLERTNEPESSQLTGRGRQGKVLRANLLASGIRNAIAPSPCRSCQGQALAKKPSREEAPSRKRIQRPSCSTLVSLTPNCDNRTPILRNTDHRPRLLVSLYLGKHNYGSLTVICHCSNENDGNPPITVANCGIAASS